MSPETEESWSTRMRMRPPREAEWAACRMLLPETFPENHIREYLLCLQDESPRLMGAVSFVKEGDRLRGLRMHLVPALRRRGVGAEIVRRLGQQCPGALAGLVDLHAEADAARFCMAAGFRRTGGLTTVEANIETFRTYLRGLMGKGSLPAGLRTIRLAEAPLAEVARLHTEHIALQGELDPWRARFAEMPGLSHSPVALLHGKVVGMLLWEPEQDLGVVRSLVGQAAAATRWVNLLLLSAATEKIWQSGLRRVRFDFVDSNRNTRKLAGRVQARVTREIAEFTLLNVRSAAPAP